MASRLSRPQTLSGDFRQVKISEADVDTALRYLRESADDAAIAKANVAYLKEWIKSEKARCALKHPGLSQVAADTKALVDPDYLVALDAMKCAVEDDARHGFKREAADALIRAWQTKSSNLRSEGKAYA